MNCLGAVSSFGQAPNIVRKNQVAALFAEREDLDPYDWVAAFAPQGVRYDVAEFVLNFFSEASSLPFGCVRPQDDLQADLHLNSILWGDWDYDFTEAFERRFTRTPTWLDSFEESEHFGNFLVLLSQTSQDRRASEATEDGDPDLRNPHRL